MANSVAMSAKPTHNAASTHTFSIERSSLVCKWTVAGELDSATSIPVRSHHLSRRSMGQRFQGELLHPFLKLISLRWNEKSSRCCGFRTTDTSTLKRVINRCKDVRKGGPSIS